MLIRGLMPGAPTAMMPVGHMPKRPMFAGESGDRFERRPLDYAAVFQVQGVVSDDFKRQVTEALSYFPEEDIRTLLAENYAFIAAPTVDTVLPNPDEGLSSDFGLSDKSHQYETVGLCHTPHNGQKKIIVAEYYRNSKNGELGKNPEVAATVAEEVSHAIDHVYRDVSWREEFTEAFNQDIDSLTPEERAHVSRAWNIELDKLKTRTLRYEIFASLYGTWRQGRTLDRDFPVLEKFPRSLAFIQNEFVPGRGTQYPVRKPITGPIRIPIRVG